MPPAFVNFDWSGYDSFPTTNVTVNTPAGLSAGNTIYASLIISTIHKGSVVPPGSATQVGSWIDGVADGFDAPSFGLFKIIYDGVATNYTFSWSSSPTTDRGGSLVLYGYNGSGAGTVVQTVIGTNGSSASARSSPAITGESGNKIIAFHGGSAIGVTLAYTAPFTERVDVEWFGLDGCGDADATGSSQACQVTPTGGATQSMWFLVEIGSVPATKALVARHAYGGGCW